MSSVEGAGCLDEDIIAAFVGGELDLRTLARVDTHLATCADCLMLVTAAVVGAGGEASEAEVAALEVHGGGVTPLEQPPSSRSPGRFERRQMIAQGGMGAVYYGHDRETGGAVAIKQLKPGLALAQPGLISRFIREAEILRRLDHPNIVKMVASVMVGDEHQIVMEYVSGGSLRQLLRHQRRLPVSRAAAIVLELADALSRAHHLGVIHRDIKPENVLLTQEGTPKLGDFGLAMMVDAGLSTSNALLGTIAYLSPEALCGQALDARADLWALGVMMFEMISGRRPFEASAPAALVTAILHQPTPDLEALCPGAPVELLDLVYRLLEKDRNQRIASARQVGAELEIITREPGEPLHFADTLAGRDPAALVPTGNPRLLSRLPAQTTAFVGRAGELSELVELLGQPDVRAVTIIGPGGMGKSSLALELGRQLASGATSIGKSGPGAERPLSGVFFVDLAPLESAELIVAAVAEAVRFQFKPGGDPKRQLLDYFREKHLLLLLDNFEHVIAGAGFVNELLQTAALVKVLATSRERLGLRAEAPFMLSGLGMPAAGSDSAAADLAAADPRSFSAVELFVDSARRARFRFEPNDEETADIVRICRLVHGMPLGIVLAASWIDTLSLPEIHGEIGKNVDFLRSEAGDLPSRQQSIRAVFDHSWALLGPEEQATLAAVSLFRGGFTRAAAEAVTRASLRTLAALVAKSLLRRVPETGRFEIHELLRQYAEARLRSTPAEHEAATDRLAGFYSGFCNEREAYLHGPRRHQAVREIQAELDNIRMAVQWMLEHAGAPRLWPVLHTLGQFYQCRRSRVEGERVFASVVSAFEPLLSDDAPDVRRALGLALIYQSLFCDQLGRKRAAVELVTRSVEVLGRTEPNGDYGMALVMYAYTCAGVGEPADIVARLEEGIALHRAKGEGWWLIRGLVVSTRVYVGVVGDLAKAEACLQECIALQKSLGNGTIFYPDSLGALGLIRSAQGHRREGCDLMLESLRIAESSDDVWAMLLALQFAARAHRDLGDYAAAELFVRRCILHARELGSIETVAWCHLTLGSVLREQGRLEDAVAEYRQGAEQSGGELALIAKAELGLGEVALQRGDSRTAERHLTKSLGICEEHRIKAGLRAVLEALGYVACEEARHDDARNYFRRAFELASGRQKPAALLGVIVGVAWWCARSGQPVRAAELASLALHHPATNHPILARRIHPLLAELKGTLGAAELDAALARGKSSPLDRVFADSFP